MIHLGKNTKSISSLGGNATYRGKVEIKKNSVESESLVKCDSLILDKYSISDTIPVNILGNKDSNIEHEAVIKKASEETLKKKRATELIILGFISEFKNELPMEYAVE